MQNTTQSQTGDLFGMDDSALIEAETLSKTASKKQSELKKRLSAIRGAAKNPKLARQEGVDVNDVDAVNARIGQLQQEVNQLENWHTNPELVSMIRQEAGLEQAKQQETEVPQRADPQNYDKFDINANLTRDTVVGDVNEIINITKPESGYKKVRYAVVDAEKAKKLNK